MPKRKPAAAPAPREQLDLLAPPPPQPAPPVAPPSEAASELALVEGRAISGRPRLMCIRLSETERQQLLRAAASGDTTVADIIRGQLVAAGILHGQGTAADPDWRVAVV